VSARPHPPIHFFFLEPAQYSLSSPFVGAWPPLGLPLLSNCWNSRGLLLASPSPSTPIVKKKKSPVPFPSVALSRCVFHVLKRSDGRVAVPFTLGYLLIVPLFMTLSALSPLGTIECKCFVKVLAHCPLCPFHATPSVLLIFEDTPDRLAH